MTHRVYRRQTNRSTPGRKRKIKYEVKGVSRLRGKRDKSTPKGVGLLEGQESSTLKTSLISRENQNVERLWSVLSIQVGGRCSINVSGYRKERGDNRLVISTPCSYGKSSKAE